MPKVSVIIPNYNHARFLDKRIQSVLNQTYQDFELLLLDDVSTDDSLAVFAKYADDPRVRILVNAINTGNPFKQWNKGVREAEGEYVWIAESDDYADPHLLEILVAELDRTPNVGIAYCQSLAVDEEEAPLYSLEDTTSELDAVRWKQNFVSDGREECRKYLIVQNTIPNASAVVFRKKIYDRVQGASEAYRTCADWLLWVEMLTESDVAFVAQTLNFFRRHSSSVIRKNQNTLVAPLESYKAVDRIKRLVPPDMKSYRLACLRLRIVWLGHIHGRRLDSGRWREHIQILRVAGQVDKFIYYWLIRRFLVCTILGR